MTFFSLSSFSWSGDNFNDDEYIPAGDPNCFILILALEEGIPITDPSFYASEERCPDSLIEHVFRVAPHASEDLPLLPERIAIMREVGAILCAVSVAFPVPCLKKKKKKFSIFFFFFLPR